MASLTINTFVHPQLPAFITEPTLKPINKNSELLLHKVKHPITNLNIF